MTRLRSIVSWLLRVPPWKLFLWVFVVPSVLQLAATALTLVPRAFPLAMDEQPAEVLAEWLALPFQALGVAWGLAFGSFLHARRGAVPRLGFHTFNFALAYLLALRFLASALPSLSLGWTTSPWLSHAAVFVGTISALYAGGFLARELTIDETGDLVTPATGKSAFWKWFFLLWFWPIGVWFIQARINRLSADGAPSGQVTQRGPAAPPSQRGVEVAGTVFLWIFWLALMSAMPIYKTVLGGGKNVDTGARPVDAFLLALFLVPVVVACAMRWLVLPRLDNPWLKLFPFLVGMAFAESLVFYGIFLVPEFQSWFFYTGVLMAVQFLPWYPEGKRASR